MAKLCVLASVVTPWPKEDTQSHLRHFPDNGNYCSSFSHTRKRVGGKSNFLKCLAGSGITLLDTVNWSFGTTKSFWFWQKIT